MGELGKRLSKGYKVSLWTNKNGLKPISNGCITMSILKTTELCALGELYAV